MNEYTTKSQLQENLLFTLDTGAMYAWMDGELWISLSRIWPYLGTIERVFSLSSGKLIELNDIDGGLYMQLDEFIKIMPADVQKNLHVMERRMMRTVRRKGGAK